MNTEPVPVLADPLVLANRLYLRAADGKGVVRPPSPPLLMSVDGQVAASLEQYRHTDGNPGGGGVVTVCVDLGSPWVAAEQADVAVPPEFAELVAPQHRDGVVRLMFGGRELASAPVGAGARPVVGLAGNLDIVETILLKEALEQPGTGSPLWATVEGHLGVDAGGMRATVAIDAEVCRGEVARSETVTTAEVAGVVDRLVRTGAIRITADGSGDGVEFLVRAFAAAALFEPVADGAPWMVVPGLQLPGYDPAGALRPRANLQADLTIAIDGTLLPWFAAAPLRPPLSAVRTWDLYGSRLAHVIVVELGEPWPADVVRPCVEARIGDGALTTVPLAGEAVALRMGATTDWDHTYDYRLIATRPDGTRLTGPWSTTQERILVIQPTELAPADDPARS